MFAIEHPSDKTLSRLWSEDLPAAATESILAHLESCAECGKRLAAEDSSIERFGRFVELIDSHLPAPPRAWVDIRTEMERVDRPVRRSGMRRPVWIGAIAASILLTFLIWPRGSSVARAETLLVRAKAAAGKAPSRKTSRLRVATRKALFVRPAVVATDDPGDSPLGAQFLAARYDWGDPLSAAAFRTWRDQLRQKTDRVSQSGGHEPIQYRVETSTTDSVLRDASIVFEGPELTPVGLRLVFDDGGWMEITALPEAPATVPASPDPTPTKVPAVPETPDTGRQLAERELAVRLAIDALSTGTPAPVSVEVAPEGSIVVTPYHLSPEQERQLDRSLAGKAGVLLNAVERDGGPDGRTASGDEEPSIGTAGNIASLAHLLAGYADRFPPAREALLEPAGRVALRALRLRRIEQLISQLDKLHNQLAAAHVIERVEDSPVTSREPDPSLDGLVQAAGALNRLVTASYTTGADHVEPSIAQLELTREMGKVRRLARQYEHDLKPPAGERR
jgi:hypothetical protein